MMEKNIPWNILGKYISGECTPQEREEIERWIKANPDHAKLVEELQEIWKDSKTDNNWNMDTAWHKISNRLDKRGESSLRLVKTPGKKSHNIQREQKKRYRSFGVRIVASLAFLFAVLISVYLLYNAKETPSAPLTTQEIVAEKGQRSQFQLSDGTRVWLNADGELRILANFTSGVREVYLEGEAFFIVEPDPDNPFVIHAGESMTRVLGTQFNIEAYPGEDIKIVVEEGRVAFGSRENMKEASELNENQIGIMSGNRLTQIRNIENLDRYIGWTKGKLIFRDTPLPRVVKKLERWYDIECTIIGPELKNRTITASFQDESLTEILEIISLSVGMTYERNKRSIKFLPEEDPETGK